MEERGGKNSGRGRKRRAYLSYHDRQAREREANMDSSRVYGEDEGEPEPLKIMWIESEKAGHNLAEVAVKRWVRQHWSGFVRSRWLQHLQGKRFWTELDRGDFGLLIRCFPEHALLLDRALDRAVAGQTNLDIVCWAIDWGIPTAPLLEVLEAIDINSRRLLHRFDDCTVPVVWPEWGWLTWNEGTVVRLARHMDELGDFELLPVLGDALEDAGCADATILGHCRSGGPYPPWSWLVDQILERAG
jgi:hypothetical protein